MLDEQTLVPELPELPWQLRLGLVFVDEKPTLFALYRRAERGAAGQRAERGAASQRAEGGAASGRAEGGGGGRVVAWLMVLPGDHAVLIPVDETPSRPIVTTLRNVQRRWLRVLESELVQVVGPQAQHMI